MINYFKIAFRTLLKRKSYSLLNILGLTVGMTCCLLIFHYVSYERSFDKEAQSENVYRIYCDDYGDGELQRKWATIFPAVGPYMKKDFPEVEDYCRMYHSKLLLSNDASNTRFHETKGYFAEPSFVKLFHTEFVAGDPKTALTGPDKIIISEAMAKKYFGDQPAVGKKLTVNTRLGPLHPYEVTGVFKAHPKNSHLVIDYLVSFETFRNLYKTWGQGFDTETSFDIIDFYTYLKLRKGTDIKKLEAKFVPFCNKYLGQDRKNGTWEEYHLTAVEDIHLYSNYNQEAEVNGNGQQVAFLFLIAVFIICIAWMNYINLSTARAAERAKEVGVKKTLGASKSHLVRQFITENVLLNSISLSFSFLVFYVSLKNFDQFTGHEGYTGMTLSPENWRTFFLVFIGGTVLSGIYPAFVLSGFQPVKVLKGSFKSSSKGIFLRKSLIVLQFVISVVLIAGTVIVFQQVQYMRKKDLGVRIDQTLVLKGAVSVKKDAYSNVFQAFKNELLAQSGVKKVTVSNHVMGQEIFEGTGGGRMDVALSNQPYMSILLTDYDFVDFYGIKFISGRNFKKEYTADSKAGILNICALKALGFANPGEAMNKKVVLYGYDTLNIIGVMADYHQEGLQKPIVPIIMALKPGIRSYYSMKLDAKDPQRSLATIKEAWNRYFPSDPFEYFFLEESFDRQYKADVLFGKVFALFAFLAIFIACLGLLGLSAYNVVQRTKEIGVRKVLGASDRNIVVLLSSEFSGLIVFSLLLSLPLTWYLMNKWLEDYAYRITVSLWVLFAAGVVAIVIALITIGLQAVKAARVNPVKSLRTE